MRRRGHRRGFSIVEVVVVSGLVALAATASLLWFGSSARPDDDAAAKAALLSFIQAQDQAHREGSPVLDATGLTERDYTRSYTTGVSNGPQNVSVAVSGTLSFAAVGTSGGACWMVRYDAAPTAGSAPVTWYVSQSANCSATNVNALPPGSPGDGESPNSPIIV